MIRLESIASLVTKDAKVIDIGTDHAYLPIYLYQNNITKNITAADISKNVIDNAQNNIIKNGLENKIKVILSDGFKDTTEDYDEAVIAGMGTKTIMNILNHKKIPNSIIISSHNNLKELRVFMLELGYKITKEIVVRENNIYYDIIKYAKGKDNLSKADLLIGKSNNIDYYKYLLKKYKDIYKLSKNETYLDYIKIIERKLDEMEK